MLKQVVSVCVLSTIIFLALDSLGLTRSSCSVETELSGSAKKLATCTTTLPVIACPGAPCTAPTNCVISVFGLCASPWGGNNGTDGCKTGTHPACAFYAGCAPACSCKWDEALCAGAPVAGACPGACVVSPTLTCNCDC